MRISIIFYVYNEIRKICLKNMSKYVKKYWEIFKDSLKTHQNRAPRALGALNSESTRKMRYGTGFKIENGAWNVCFMTETCAKIVWKLHENGMLMVCEWYVNGIDGK